MKPKDLAAKQHFIHRVEAQMKEYIAGAWFCMIFAIFFACFDIHIYMTDVRPFSSRALVVGQAPMAGWGLVIMFGISVLTLSVLSVLNWSSANRAQGRLTKLKAIASAMASEEQPGVWPPPPNGPKV